MAKLKVAVLVPDGAADRPLEQLGGLTPLEAARTPNMDEVAARGATGLLRTVPPGMQPGSDVANLSLLGYDPRSSYGGRGPIEAASMGVEVPPGWTAFRCNLVTADGRRMLDYSAGHIGQAEAGEAIAALQEALGDVETSFHQGKSYRNILLLKGDYAGVACTPPHDITGEPLEPNMPGGPGADRLLELIERSQQVLAQLPANERLSEAGRPRADLIWPWGQGKRMRLESFSERFGIAGGCISAVDLVNGLAVLTGLRVVTVAGATGFLDTNYRAKGAEALRVLDAEDFVYVHVEAPDEASHMGDIREKVLALERFDAEVVGPVAESLDAGGESRLLVCPDHPTLISTRTHDASPVPYAACGTGISPGGANAFTEKQASGQGPHFTKGWEMMLHLTGNKSWPENG